MQIDHNVVAAWSALIAALVAIIAIILEGRRSRFALGVDLILRLSERFDGEPFREIRRKAATAIRNNSIENADDVLVFFETVGMLTRRGALDKEAVWCQYAHFAYYYWHCCRDFVERRRAKNPSSWSDFTYLYNMIFSFDQRRSGSSSFRANPSEDDLQKFLDDEENLPVGYSRQS